MKYLLPLLILLPTTLAQFATDCGPSLQTTFNQCASNSLTDGNGQPAPAGSSVEQACASVQANQAAYYCCLCKGFTGIQGCIANYCPQSASAPSIGQSVAQFCGACQPASSSTVSRVSASNVPFPTLSGGLPSASATPSATPAPTAGTQAKGAAAGLGVQWGIAVMGVVGGAVALV
ncbi:uncharacterized protein SPPG_03419 [Spizellomyces punctatus DAOM BR117]|uniref:Uncharacterized protein n=1 Tax=Spizellomyces punctatus (strain DAOM BR117) TaxID=645134 RepID=A0A0L0HJJ2_SPIPD|nr:uncharacterized protein SPPG_03419 [Spizellomyces punctatus DAOM BR117]KND01621.1 hypothetical protein SPPG_03419 [Spizellomyces punctatus DAOM BR117]|eukprot:XP_016609660.1 hypothetical protein SPPG_03419 [Spizellomyces punctatus DAOM BR117]